eukprot:g76907.t1
MEPKSNATKIVQCWHIFFLVLSPSSKAVQKESGWGVFWLFLWVVCIRRWTKKRIWIHPCIRDITRNLVHFHLCFLQSWGTKALKFSLQCVRAGGVDSSYRMPHHTQVAVFTVCEQRLVVPPLLDDARHLCSVKQASNVFPNAPS